MRPAALPVLPVKLISRQRARFRARDLDARIVGAAENAYVRGCYSQEAGTTMVLPLDGVANVRAGVVHRPPQRRVAGDPHRIRRRQIHTVRRHDACSTSARTGPPVTMPVAVNAATFVRF